MNNPNIKPFKKQEWALKPPLKYKKGVIVKIRNKYLYNTIR